MTIQRGGGYWVSPPVPWDNYTVTHGDLNVNTFFAIFSNFFRRGSAVTHSYTGIANTPYFAF